MNAEHVEHDYVGYLCMAGSLRSRGFEYFCVLRRFSMTIFRANENLFRNCFARE